MNPISWRGVFPAVTTQFRADFSLDLPATLQHVDTLLAEGVHGLIMLGTVGENCSLEPTEKFDLLSLVVQHVAGRVPVLSGVAEYTTALACRFSARAAALKVDGLMVLPGMVYKSDARGNDRPLSGRGPGQPAADFVLQQPRVLRRRHHSPDVRRPWPTNRHSWPSKNPARTCAGSRICAMWSAIATGCSVASTTCSWRACFWAPRAGSPAWSMPSRPRTAVCGTWPRARRWEEARALYAWYTPLLHLDTRVKLVQCIKLAMAEVKLGSETVRPPRLPLAGSEREEVLAIIRESLRTRPKIN